MTVPALLTGGGAAAVGHLSLVLDEPLARGDGLQRAQSFALDAGASCCDAAQSHGAISFANAIRFLMLLLGGSKLPQLPAFNAGRCMACQ